MNGMGRYSYSLILVVSILSGCGGGGTTTPPSCAVPCLTPTPFCDTTTHLCVACLEDSDCNPGTICAVDQGGKRACVKGCKSDADCAAQGLAGQTCCNRACVDTRTSLMSCGACGMVCSPPAHGVASCASGKCGIASCEASFADCDGMAANGCEVSTLGDPKNCGGCGKACPAVANGMPGCTGGACGIDACVGSFSDCDKQLANGCEVDTSMDLANCGACGKACGNVANGTPICKLGACSIAVCAQGFGNCDNDYANGCEAQLAGDVKNCGNCGRACAVPPNATATCSGGSCGIGGCNMGFADCDGVLVNGCESDVSADPANCGGCGRACPVIVNGVGACKGNACVITSCDNGFADCDGVVQNGCEAHLATNLGNCGACGKACAGVANGIVACQAGACVIGSCNFGYADCDGSAQNGCEVATGSDPMNCGACAKICPFITNGAPGCNAGTCGVGSCNAGFGDCNGSPIDGCERSLNADPNNCGACGRSCAGVANGSASCVNAKCTILSCNNGYADCDNDYANGCEVNKQSDVRNCGGCGIACAQRPNATPACAAQSCSFSCNLGYTDCDLQAQNGCEAQLAGDPNNCGSCGKVCSLPNANAGCANSNCTIGSCLPGYSNCDGVNANGCERATATDPANCGACGRACTAVANATNGCANSNCVIASCLGAYKDCDGQYANGCEINSASDVANCGACSRTCAAVANGVAGCSNSNCVIASCAALFADCDGQYGNGCELPTGADINNCGGCNKVCPVVANGLPTCAGGACGANCNAGFGNCDGQLANGCETNLLASLANCGSCGRACTFTNGSGSCQNGGCVLSGCNAGYGSCDGNDANGCEASLNTDRNNCGGCGNVCGGNQTCVAGICKNGFKVLLVHAESTPGYYTDVQTKLMATGAFTNVDLFYAGGGTTPTVAQLQAYDSVYIWSDGTFTNPTLLGDNLATYYDGGGQVVISMFALASSYTVAGRFGTVANGYMLMTPANYNSTAASKGTVNEPNSPLVAGFTSLTTTYGFRGTGTLANGAVTVAAWSDGTPLVIRGVIKGRNRADVNMWPTSSSAYTGGWSGDAINLIKNALLYR